MLKLRRAITSIAFVVLGLLTTLGYSAVAQMSQPAPISPAPMTRPAPGMMRPLTGTSSALDQAFFLDAARAGMGNIMMGQLALQKATSAEAKQFAQAEINEQNQVKADLTRIAPQLGLALPSDPMPKQRAAMALLSQLSGDRFNQAYLDEGGVNAHLENAALFQREAAFGQNPDLVSLANRGLPIIRQHFTTASSLTNYRFAVARRFPLDRPASGAVPTTPAPVQ